MKYLVSRCDCRLDNGHLIKSGVRYVLTDKVVKLIDADDMVRLVDIEESDSILRVKVLGDDYYFLDINNLGECSSAIIKYQNYLVSVSLAHILTITIDGELVANEKVSGIEYSHFEIVGEKCLIYFVGKRNFIVILQGKKMLTATYFDEYNQDNEDRYYLLKLYDSLNHGRVYHINKKEYEDYLVYLDDDELKMHDEFVGMVFLDCIMAGNLKYANNMLKEDIRQSDHSLLSTFFTDFDYFYPVNAETFILTKKNTLAGIYRFEYISREISNIIEMK